MVIDTHREDYDLIGDQAREIDRLREELSQCTEAMEIGVHPAAQRIMQLEQQIKQLQGNFSHFHVDNEMNELCALCGLAVINAVHLRSR